MRNVILSKAKRNIFLFFVFLIIGNNSLFAQNPPVVLRPANGISALALSVSLSWDTAGLNNQPGTRYWVQVSLNSADWTAPVFEDSTHSDSTIALPGLNYNKTYYWRIAAGNAPAWSAWSAVYSFTTMLPAPVLLKPLNGSVKIPLTDTLKWFKDTSSATVYRLQLSTIGTFSTRIIDTLLNSVNDTTKILWGLNYGSTYYWRVKAKSATDSSDWSSVFSFTLTPFLRVNSPNTNVNWTVDSTVNITWTSLGLSDVKIEYSHDGGNTYYTIASGVNAALGTYAWLVPDSSSVQCKIRISSTADATTADSSDVFFTIPLNPTLTVLFPNGGESIAVDSVYNIRWSKSNIAGNIKIEYTINNGATYNLITTAATSSLSYLWTIPNTPGAQCKIRISNVTNPRIADSSDVIFTIPAAPAIAITSPDGTENWAIDSTVFIRWTRTNLSGTVKIEYSTNNGVLWSDIATNVPVSQLYYQWTIPNGVAGQWKIRITNEHNPAITATSNAIAISAPTLSITIPIGTENWVIDSTVFIRWARANLSGTIKLELSTDNGVSWNNIATNIQTSQQYYQWTLPNSTPGQWKFRITNEHNPTIQNVSNAITIGAPGLAVTSPNGAESWIVGSTHNITWTRTNISGNVKLEYSFDNGNTYNTIVASVPASSLSYVWTIPNNPSPNCKVRITHANYISISDSSNAVFTIPVPLLTLTSPNGGELWIAGSSYNITWTSSSIAFVKLEYSTDSMATWNSITASIPGNSSPYNWTIPAVTPSTKCFVRISDAVFGSQKDTSNAKFEITSASVTLTAPNDLKEKWQAGTTHLITWTYINIANVLIEYTTNNGSSWNTITSRPAADLSWNWVVPDYPSTQCKIRISSSANSGIFDISDSLFTISRIQVISPNGGEHWQAGRTKPITWDGVNIDTLLIEYSADNGLSWLIIKDSLPPGTGSFNWVVPSGISSSVCKVRITDRSGFSDMSDNVFTIYDLEVTSPNGGEFWQAKRQRTITWNSIGNPAVKIDYTLNNGLKWYNIIASAAGGSYVWTLPDTAAANCRVRISVASDTAITDSSDAVFNITKLKLLRPVGGEFLQVGKTDSIKWSDSDVSNLRIEYTTDDGGTWKNIALSTSPVTGSYSWVVPNFPNALSRVRILNTAYPSVSDSSGIPFTIYNLDVSSPNGGEYWQAGTKHMITWSDSNLANVKIDYSTNGGTTYNTIIASTPSGIGGGNYEWDIPLTINTSGNCKIRISDAGESRIIDTSNTVFTIYKLNVTAPNTNVIWKSGSLHNITWTSGNITSVNINYSTNNGSNWISVASNLSAAGGSYSWRVPNTPSTQCKIKISSYTDSLNVFDINDTVFTISSLVVLSPNGGENWKAGTIHSILWSSVNTTTINIEYSSNNGLGWTAIASNLSASAGSYNWIIPATPTVQGLIRIIDSADVAIADTCDNTFTISDLALVTPNGGERWQAGSRHNITWTQSNLTKIKLEYSINGGGAWIFIDSVIASALSYSWAVPDAPSTTVLVRISDNRNSATADTSNAVFSICKLVVTSPNGGEYWQYGLAKNITWSGIYVDSVRVEYSLTNGATWIVLKDSMQNSGTYSWVLPAQTSTQCRVRVVDFHDNTIADTSNNPFTIYQLDVLSPNGGEYWQVGTTKNITWQSVGIANVKIEFTTDGGLTYQNVIASTSAFSGSYSWLIPNYSSSNCKVRISDASLPGMVDSSNAVFTIYKLNVLYPNGGEYLQAGKKDTIKWAGGGSIATVRIEYSSNGGTSWVLIKDTSAAANKYAWTIPATPSNQCLVRVSDLLNPSVFDTSDARFTIYKLDVTYPTNKEYFQTGKTKTITWSFSGTISKVKLEFTTDNGVSWNYISTVPAVPSTYAWVIPNQTTSQMRIRVSDSSNVSIQDYSDSLSHIYQLDLFAPGGGESWLVNSRHDIRWGGQASITSIKLEYSINNGTSWLPITGAANLPMSPNSFSWLIPNTPATACKVRASSIAEPNYIDTSAGLFYIRYIDLYFLTAGSSFSTPGTPNIEPVASGTPQNLTINAVLRNDGDTAVSNIRLAYMLATDTTVTSGYVFIDSVIVATLAAKSSVTKTLVFPWPQTIPGDAQYYVGFWVDKSDTVIESNHANNKQFISTPKLNNIWKPDLVCIENAIDPPNTSPDDVITIYYKIKNQGFDTAGTSVIRVYYSTSNAPDTTTGTNTRIATINLNTLNAAQELTNQSLSLTIPHTLARGRYYVKFFVDATRARAEMLPNGETNNVTVFSAPFRVFWSNLKFVYGRYFPTETGVGDTLFLVSWVTNADTGTSMPAKLTYSMTPGNTKRAPIAGDPWMGSKIIPKLGPFETWKDTSYFPVPNVANGFHWIGSWIDTNNAVTESLETDNTLIIDDGQTIGIYIQQGLTIMTDESDFNPKCVGYAGSITVTTKIANWNIAGTAPINRTIRYYLYPSNTRLGTTETAIVGLRAQKDTTISWSYTFVEPPGPAEGRHSMAWGSPGLSNYKNEPYLDHTHSAAVLWDQSTFSPDTIGYSMAWNVNAVVRNMGNAAFAAGTNLRIYLSQDMTIATTDYPANGSWSVPVPALTPGQQVNIPFTVTSFPPDSAARPDRVPVYPNYYVGFYFTSAFGAAPRTYFIYAPRTLTVTNVRPDLVGVPGTTFTLKTPGGQVISDASKVLAGDSIIINSLVSNNYNGAASNDFSVRYYMVDSTQVTNPTWDMAHGLFGSVLVNAASSPILPWSTRAVPIYRGVIPADLTPGTYYLGTYFDCYGNLPLDLDKTNNKYPRTLIPALKINVQAFIFGVGSGGGMYSNIKAHPGTRIGIPVKIGKVDGIAALYYKFNMIFDSSILRPTGEYSLEGSICSDWDIEYNILNEGKIEISSNGFGRSAISDTGTLVTLYFDVIGGVGKTAQVDFPEFKLSRVNLFGSSGKVFVTDGALNILDNMAIPVTYKLEQNYPNPFNPNTTIRYSIPYESDVTIKIYDILGREIRTIMQNRLPVGWFEIPFNASNMASGVYFYRIHAKSNSVNKEFMDVKKMLLIK